MLAYGAQQTPVPVIAVRVSVRFHRSYADSSIGPGGGGHTAVEAVEVGADGPAEVGADGEVAESLPQPASSRARMSVAETVRDLIMYAFLRVSE